MITSLEAIHVHQLNQLSNGEVTVTYPVGSNTVLSVQIDGSIETRPQGTDGAYERAKVQGSSLVYAPNGKNGLAYLIPFASTIPNV